MTRTCWITGASSGIGRSTALYFAKNSYTVIASSRSVEKLNDLVNNCTDLSLPGRIIALPLDVTVTEDGDKSIKYIKKEIKQLDLVILNAGTYIKEDSKSATINSTKLMIDLNYTSVFNHIISLQPFVHILKIKQIAVVSSMAAWRGLPMAAAYSSSKSAIKTAIESFEIDYSNTDLSFRLIYPGFIKTPLTDKNDFKMPFIIEADKAAEKIYKNLLFSKKFEVSFPLIFSLIMRCISLLPWSIYKWLMIKKVHK